jgi:hypothetical protein
MPFAGEPTARFARAVALRRASPSCSKRKAPRGNCIYRAGPNERPSWGAGILALVSVSTARRCAYSVAPADNSTATGTTRRMRSCKRHSGPARPMSAWSSVFQGRRATDAFATFAGTTTGTGTDDLSEVLSNGVSLTLHAPGATSAMFSAIQSLSVIKDQSDFAGSAGSADSSILGNAFSVTAVPEPSTWAMLLVGFAGLGLAGYRQRRKASLA